MMNCVARRVFVAFGVWCLSVVLLPAQGFLPTSPPIALSSTNIQTMGGITYLTCSAKVVDGEIAWWPEVLRDGTNLSVALGQVPYECMIEPWLCESVTNRQTSTIVLGVLPSGNYHLWVYEFNRVPVHTVVWQSFSVPESSGGTLMATRSASGIELGVNGPALAGYSLEASTNLADWKAVYKSSGVGFTFHTTAPLSHQFFRVAVTNGVVVLP